jgi:hypothetical protein
MLEKLNLLAFVLAFSFGMLAVYAMKPKPQIVARFPSPSNAAHSVYKDAANTCFKFKASQVSCPLDKTKIKPQPVVDTYVDHYDHYDHHDLYDPPGGAEKNKKKHDGNHMVIQN